MRKELKVCWLSAGISSFVAGWLNDYGYFYDENQKKYQRSKIDEWIYIDVADQHPDSMRFIKDCEKAIGKKITIIKAKGDVESACREGGFVNRPKIGTYCTKFLKKKIRTQWEEEHKEYAITYVWGFDLSERERITRMREKYPEFNHEFPLIDLCLTKQDAHGYFKRKFDFPRPVMYEMGYNNNNCIGCVKGGMGYFNKIRVDFPEVFEKRAKLERELHSTCLNGIYLDELDPTKGRIKAIEPECSLMCLMALE